jgi:hypothetical protein
MQVSLKSRLNALIDAALNERPRASDEETTSSVMADPAIVWDVARMEIDKRVRARRRSAPASHPYQAFFEGYGFRTLDEAVVIKTGAVRIEMPRGEMAPIDLRDYIRSLEISAESRKKLVSARKLLADMSPYARVYRRSEPKGIFTVQRYFELLAAGTPPPQVGLTPTERSLVAKRRWESMTPEQRRASHEKRLKTRASKTAAARP